MKAIDELRKTADECTTMAGIENKFETVWITKKAFMKMLDAIEREMEEEYVALPKDVNGDVWRVGDLVVGEINPNNPKRVERMLWYGPDSGWQLETDSIVYPCPERPRHYHAPTVEDVLEEYRVKYYDLVTDMECKNITNEEYVQGIRELASEFAKRLQLRGEHDG